MRKRILTLVFTNLLWGLIPWPASKLFVSYSFLLVIFSRFMVMAVTLFVFVGLILANDYRSNKSSSSDVPSLHPKLLWHYLRARNPEFFQLPQWLYLLILGTFGLAGNIILYFWGLKTVGAVITSIGFIVALILLTFVNWMLGKEDISNFKLLYLATLFVAMMIIGYVGTMQENPASGDVWQQLQNYSGETLLLIAGYAVTLAFFFLGSASDRMTEAEYFLSRTAPQYKLMRTFTKLAVLSLFSALSLIPMCYIIVKTQTPNELTNQIFLFFAQIDQWWALVWTPSGMILMFVCTILPFILYFLLAASWPKTSSFDLWAGVLQLLEPAINIIVGIMVLGEVFPLSWLGIVYFLLGVAILTRYFGETEAQMQVILLLKIHPSQNQAAMNYMYLLKSVRRVQSMVGEYDILVDLQFSSQRGLNEVLQNKLPYVPGIKKYGLHMISQIVWDQSIPDLNKGFSLLHRKGESK